MEKIEYEVTDEDPSLLLVDGDEAGQVAPGGEADPVVAPVVEPQAEPTDGIAELKAKLEAEQKERQAAQERARQLEDRAAKSEREASDGRAQTLDSRINQLASASAQLVSNTEMLKREYRDAFLAGDADKVADLQMKMSELAAQRMELDRAKSHFEQQKRAPAPQPKPATPAPATRWEQDFPRSAAWLKSNPQYGADDVGRADLAAAHARAVKAGHAVDSEAYIAYFDQHFATKADPAPAPAPRPAAPAAAPVSRQAATAPTMKTVKLTAFDREMAEASGVSLEDYARAKLATQKA